MLNFSKLCQTNVINFASKRVRDFSNSNGPQISKPKQYLSISPRQTWPLCTQTAILTDNLTSSESRRFLQTSNVLTHDIRYKDYLKKVKEGLKIVDVRNPGEIKNMGGVSGSFEIPLDQLKSAFMMSSEEWKKKFNRGKPSEDSPIMLLCASGVRSKAGVKILQQLGYSQPMSYTGGYKMFKDKK